MLVLGVISNQQQARNGSSTTRHFPALLLHIRRLVLGLVTVLALEGGLGR